MITETFGLFILLIIHLLRPESESDYINRRDRDRNHKSKSSSSNGLWRFE